MYATIVLMFCLISIWHVSQPTSLYCNCSSRYIVTMHVLKDCRPSVLYQQTKARLVTFWNTFVTVSVVCILKNHILILCKAIRHFQNVDTPTLKLVISFSCFRPILLSFCKLALKMRWVEGVFSMNDAIPIHYFVHAIVTCHTSYTYHASTCLFSVHKGLISYYQYCITKEGLLQQRLLFKMINEMIDPNYKRILFSRSKPAGKKFIHTSPHHAHVIAIVIWHIKL